MECRRHPCGPSMWNNRIDYCALLFVFRFARSNYARQIVLATSSAVAFPPQLQIGPYTCNYTENLTTNAASLLNVISALVFDVLVVIFTVYKTIRLVIKSREVGVKSSIATILLRDGRRFYSCT